jgi:hypothetical protein
MSLSEDSAAAARVIPDALRFDALRFDIPLGDGLRAPRRAATAGNGHPGKYPERIKLDLKKPARPANRVNVAAAPETTRAGSCARSLYCFACSR